MTKEDALKLALEALENISTALREDDVLGSDIELMLNAITAIKEASAQPVQEPTREEVNAEAARDVNDTNAKLASHYFDLLKVVERYEAHGVTCQTFRHFVTEPCAECNCVALLPVQERWLCRTCNKSFTDLTIIHTCTPPQENT
jgi:hypothetical protein